MRDQENLTSWSCYYSLIPTLLVEKKHFDHVTTRNFFTFIDNNLPKNFSYVGEYVKNKANLLTLLECS